MSFKSLDQAYFTRLWLEKEAIFKEIRLQFNEEDIVGISEHV